MKTSTSSFTKTVADMNAGVSLADLSGELAKIIAAVRLTGKPGSLTYKLTIKPASAGDVVTVMLEDDIKSNIPRSARPKAVFFTTEENGLTRNDPRQSEMELRSVPSAAVEPPRQVSAVNQ